MTVPSARGFILATVLATTSVACGHKPDPEQSSNPFMSSASPEQMKAKLDPNRPALESKREKLAAAVQAAKAHPALSPIASPPADEKAMLIANEEEWQGGKIPQCSAAEGEAANVLDQLAKPRQVTNYDAKQIEEAVPQVLAAKTALVCHSLRLDPLVIDEKSKSFTGGYFEGECRLFELETTKYLGGFAYSARISDQLSYGNYNPSANSFSADMSTACSDAANAKLWGAAVPKEKLYIGCQFPESR